MTWLLTFPGWIALWAAIVLILAAYSVLAIAIITVVQRVGRWVLRDLRE